ncbi:MAG: purine-nucleoside phosphorylase [Myxococcales bacterium]|nr:purine-nucleoside phosphorylase [Myxococcales bacterium]MCB9707357.1 purine-nucleoside phosphorylase [Myxococcales bacterium]
MPRREPTLPITQQLTLASSEITKQCDIIPRVAMVLGSGLGAFGEEVQDRIVLPYSAISGMPLPRVQGHAGQLALGHIGQVPIVIMEGRAHMYEGYSAQESVFGIRLMLRLGAQYLIVTNAAGGISELFAPGDLMLISDHINLTGQNCLCGPNDENLGPRFPDMTSAYDPELNALAERIAVEQGQRLRKGVYAGVLGPCYETPAEIRMLQRIGAHAVGMSTVQEVIAARHMGARIMGISCITNMAAGISEAPLSHGEVRDTADRISGRFAALLNQVIAKLH